MRRPRAKSALLLGLPALAVFIARDYRAWYSLGEGGVPHNVLGWVAVTALRARKREPLSSAPYLPLLGRPSDGTWLTGLPHREGGRPDVAPYPIPHRQLDQPGDAAARAQVDEQFDKAVTSDTRLLWQRSGYERHTVAVTVAPHLLGHQVARKARGEAAHIHPGDGSMHMIFSPCDASTVLDQGWGERHPLAGRLGLPLTYLLIYAPRTSQEADTVAQLLDASIAYMTNHLGLGLA